MAAVIIRLNTMYEGKTLLEYSRDIFGRAAPYLLGIFYLVYFMIFSTYLCYSFDNDIISNFLPKTPIWALLAAGLPIYGFIAYKGIRVLGRLSELFGILFTAIIMVIFISMFIEGKMTYILPLFNPSDIGKYFISLKDTVEPFIGIEIFLFVPFAKGKKTALTAFLTYIAIGLIYIFDVYGCYAMIGLDEIKLHKYPLIDAVRLVQYPRIEFLQRVDVAYQTIGFMRVFIAKSVLYFVIVEIISKIIPKTKRKVIVLAVGIIIFLISIMSFNIPNIQALYIAALSYSGVFSVFVIPLIVFAAAKVRKNA
jgi:spore germination protein (amino acid permease)